MFVLSVLCECYINKLFALGLFFEAGIVNRLRRVQIFHYDCLEQRPDPTCSRFEERNEMFYLTTHSTHFIYGYMASDIWLRTF